MTSTQIVSTKYVLVIVGYYCQYSETEKISNKVSGENGFKYVLYPLGAWLVTNGSYRQGTGRRLIGSLLWEIITTSSQHFQDGEIRQQFPRFLFQ